MGGETLEVIFYGDAWWGAGMETGETAVFEGMESLKRTSSVSMFEIRRTRSLVSQVS